MNSGQTMYENRTLTHSLLHPILYVILARKSTCNLQVNLEKVRPTIQAAKQTHQ
jgi:hypothetical protein